MNQNQMKLNESIAKYSTEKTPIDLTDLEDAVAITRYMQCPCFISRGSSRPRIIAYGSSQPCIIAYDSSQPRIESYGHSQPHVHSYNVSRPTIEAYDESRPFGAAYDSSQLRIDSYASSQPRMEAYDLSQPRMAAYDTSRPTIFSYCSAEPHIATYGSSSPDIESYQSSQPRIVAHGSSQPRIRAHHSSQPHIAAYDVSQPRIEARLSSRPHIEATDASRPSIEASGSAIASIVASGVSQISVRGAVTGTAGPDVAVLIDGLKAHIEGGRQVHLKRSTPAEWCAYYDVTVKDGVAILYKGVRDDYRSAAGFLYAPGTMPEAHDWNGAETECGGGLHFSPRPLSTREFDRKATRYIACPIALEDMVVYPDGVYPHKAKARRICAPCWEVDERGEPKTPPMGWGDHNSSA